MPQHRLGRGPGPGLLCTGSKRALCLEKHFNRSWEHFLAVLAELPISSVTSGTVFHFSEPLCAHFYNCPVGLNLKGCVYMYG